MSDDDDDLRRETLETEALLISLRARKRQWQVKAATADSKMAAGIAAHHIAATEEKITKAQSRLRSLHLKAETRENKEIEVEMNRTAALEADAAPATAALDTGSEWWAYLGFRDGENAYTRGETVPDETAARCWKLVEVKTIRQRPRGSRYRNAPVARAVAVPQQSAPEPTDPIEILRQAMRAVIASGRCQTMRQAFDMVDRDLVNRASKQFSEMPRGQPYRRQVDGFAEYVIGDPATYARANAAESQAGAPRLP